jgi:pyrimidine-nucleoside phosphorylase
MSQPLGNAVGNSLEVIEAIEVLKGNGPEDIKTLSVKLAGMMVYLGKRAETPEEGIALAEKALADGTALEKFKAFVRGQGGEPNVVDDYSLFPQSKYELELSAWEEGYIQSMDAMAVGKASQNSGAGRSRKEDEIDLSAGVYFCKKTGDSVKSGDIICKVYGNDKDKVTKSLEELRNAITIDTAESIKPLLIKAEVHFDEKINDIVVNSYTRS